MIEKNSEEFTFLLQLVFAVDQNNTPEVENIFEYLDEFGISFRLQNDVVAWAEDYGAMRKDVSRVARDLEEMLTDYGYFSY